MAKKNPAKKNSQPSRAAASGSRSPMDLNLLESITRMMRDNDLNTLDVRDGEKRVILTRGPVANSNSGGYTQPIMHYPPPQTGEQAGSSSNQSTPAVVDTDAGLVTIKSPMVGTFYAAATPDAKPFVSVGTTVDEDTDVCIIEAMKVFNNIKAEMSGTIQKVLISNGETVEFGQPLFLVKP